MGPAIIAVLALVAGACFVPFSKWLWKNFYSDDMESHIADQELLLKNLKKRGANSDYLSEIRNLTGI